MNVNWNICHFCFHFNEKGTCIYRHTQCVLITRILVCLLQFLREFGAYLIQNRGDNSDNGYKWRELVEFGGNLVRNDDSQDILQNNIDFMIQSCVRVVRIWSLLYVTTHLPYKNTGKKRWKTRRRWRNTSVWHSYFYKLWFRIKKRDDDDVLLLFMMLHSNVHTHKNSSTTL